MLNFGWLFVLPAIMVECTLELQPCHLQRLAALQREPATQLPGQMLPFLIGILQLRHRPLPLVSAEKVGGHKPRRASAVRQHRAPFTPVTPQFPRFSSLEMTEPPTLDLAATNPGAEDSLDPKKGPVHSGAIPRRLAPVAGIDTALEEQVRVRLL